MLVSTQRQIILRCPLCGKLEFHQISLFDFSKHERGREITYPVNCICGFNKLIITTKNYREFTLQINCLICEQIHILKFKRAEIWDVKSLVLTCPEIGQDLGYIGTETVLDQIVKRQQDNPGSIINNFGFEDYFTNPEVMIEVLKHLHQIAAQNKLVCSCGNNQIEIDVFPEKLELRCPFCQSIHIIYAETMEDLCIVKKTKIIIMTEKGFTSFDSSKIHPNFKS
ncbi:MAG: hypothetical protein K6U80_13105 [Firmicutes bacterium]|nr:hypothetical protein [Bacillota bacterium]